MQARAGTEKGLSVYTASIGKKRIRGRRYRETAAKKEGNVLQQK